MKPQPRHPSPHLQWHPPHAQTFPSSLLIITLWYKCWMLTIARRGWLRHLSICPGSGGGHSWRSCWRWWVQGPAAARWWAASLWMAACSPWRWPAGCGAVGQWRPTGISLACCCAPLLCPAPSVCTLQGRRGGEERAKGKRWRIKC